MPTAADESIPRFGLTAAVACGALRRYSYGGRAAQAACRLHTHDRPEVFWIDAGRCRHLVNGPSPLLSP